MKNEEKADVVFGKEKEVSLVEGNVSKRDERKGGRPDWKDRRRDREEEKPWIVKTELGKKVFEGKITDIDFILDNNLKILEAGIVDKLIPVESDLILIGQAKGKFGGGKRRAWKQTQKKTEEGNVLSFSAMAVVGDRNGHVGIGTGKAKETLPAREKAVRKAKLNLIKVTRGCSSFDCNCREMHTVPFIVSGKAGSSRITLFPAPQGTGLVVNDQAKKVLKLAGIKDVYSRTEGKIKTAINLTKACIDALRKTNLDKRKVDVKEIKSKEERKSKKAIKEEKIVEEAVE